MFEIIKRDGMARIGRFRTNSDKILETPALLPVVNPKICTIQPKELYDNFGFRQIITNSYIIKNTPDLNNKARMVGIHDMLGFPGIIMTDSGTFQNHMYGNFELTNTEIIEFQKLIGSDIGTVLDVFTEPYWTKEHTYKAIEVTLERTQQACEMKCEMMINGVVQGSIYTDLREYCAKRMSSMDVDVHPIGGIVPLMEQYLYTDLVNIVMSQKKGLNPSRPVHLFGAGHPMILALAVMMGCDLFDSSSYAKFARDDRMMFVDGTFRLSDMEQLNCKCPSCIGHTIKDLKNMNKKTRTALIARHNLNQIIQELSLIRRYIYEGRLWELVETRCRAHPAILSALRSLKNYQDIMEQYDPISRDGAMFYTGPESRNRPVFMRYLSRINTRYVPPTSKAVLFKDCNKKPYNKYYKHEFDKALRAGYTPIIITPFGPVPMDLDEIYPIPQSLFPDIVDMETDIESKMATHQFLKSVGFMQTIEASRIPDSGVEKYDINKLRANAVARYQFGIKASNALFRNEIKLITSKRTGKIRNVISDGEHVLSMRAGDGLYTLKINGANRIVDACPPPYMRVSIMDDAIPFVARGCNVFQQFVLECDLNIRPMDEVIITSKDDDVIATGRMFLTPFEIKHMKRGIAVKTHHIFDNTKDTL